MNCLTPATVTTTTAMSLLGAVPAALAGWASLLLTNLLVVQVGRAGLVAFAATANMQKQAKMEVMANKTAVAVLVELALLANTEKRYAKKYECNVIN